jgi:hypothetical protein
MYKHLHHQFYFNEILQNNYCHQPRQIYLYPILILAYILLHKKLHRSKFLFLYPLINHQPILRDIQNHLNYIKNIQIIFNIYYFILFFFGNLKLLFFFFYTLVYIYPISMRFMLNPHSFIYIAVCVN